MERHITEAHVRWESVAKVGPNRSCNAGILCRWGNKGSVECLSGKIKSAKVANTVKVKCLLKMIYPVLKERVPYIPGYSDHKSPRRFLFAIAS